MGPGIWEYLGQHLFGGGNPYDAAAGKLSGISGMFKPYQQAGLEDLPLLQQHFQAMMANPGEYLKQMGAGFQADPGYKWQVDQSVDAANKAAAAGGMAGTPMEQQQVQQNANQMANQQYQQYLQNAMGVSNRGAGGLGGIEQQGYGATENLATLQEMLSQLAGQSAQYQNQQGAGLGGLVGSLLGML